MTRPLDRPRRHAEPALSRKPRNRQQPPSPPLRSSQRAKPPATPVGAARPESRRRIVRTAALAAILTAGLTATGAAALGLGGFRAESALNQPFVGEIDLINLDPDELGSVKATLASADEFAKAGAERYHFLTQLGFEPRLSARGSPVIRVTSRDPIREPFIDLLVEVVSPSGRLVKGYTVLLDPPGAPGRAASQSARPAADRSAPVGVRSGGASPGHGGPEPAPSPSASQAAASAGRFPMRFGPVRPGTGLLVLARPGQQQGASLAQTALALYRNNQEAFVNGDINNLVVGATLTIPTDAELLALDPATAEQELQAALRGEPVRRAPITEVSPEGGDVAASDDAGSRIAGAASAAAAGTLEGTAAVPSSEAAAADPRQVPSAPPGAISDGLPGEGSEGPALTQGGAGALEDATGSGERIRELEAELAAIHAQLQQRAEELSGLQETAPPAPSPGDPTIAERIVEGEDPEPIASLDASHADRIEAIELPADGSAPEEAGSQGASRHLANGTESPKAEAAGSQTVARPVSDSDPAPEPAVPEADAPLPAVQAAESSGEPTEAAAAPSPSTWHSILLPLAGFAGFTAVGVLGFSWISTRRRRAEPGADEDLGPAEVVALERPASVTPSPSPVPASAPASAPAMQPLADEPPPAAAPADQSEAGLAALSSHLESLQHFDAETEEADALSEADIYVAYGRYREAEELLSREIERSPERLEARFKLAEVYAASENRHALRELMDDIQASGGDRDDPARWERLVGIAKVVEEGGIWDPGSTFTLNGTRSGTSSVATRDAAAPASAIGSAAGAGNGPEARASAAGQAAPAEGRRVDGVQGLEGPFAATGGDPASLEDEMPLLFDESALEEELSLPEQPAEEDLAWDTLDDPGPRQDTSDAGDLILTLDDLGGAGVLDLGEDLGSPSSAVPAAAAHPGDASPRRPEPGEGMIPADAALELESLLDVSPPDQRSSGEGTADGRADQPASVGEGFDSPALQGSDALADPPRAGRPGPGAWDAEWAAPSPELLGAGAAAAGHPGLDAPAHAERPDLPASGGQGIDPSAAGPDVDGGAAAEMIDQRDRAEADAQAAPGDRPSAERPPDSPLGEDRATKLDRARAYLAMNDAESARALLDEVLADLGQGGGSRP